MLTVRRCPKSGRIVGLAGNKRLGRLAVLLAGFFALLWVLERVATKPSRAAYPCVRVAAPVGASFVSYVAGVSAVTALWRKAWYWAKRSRYGLATLALGAAVCVAGLVVTVTIPSAKAENVGSFTPTDAANSPIGVAQGINPGRVTWSYDQDATNFSGSGSYADDANTDKAVVRAMLERAICVLTDQTLVADAWSALFTHFNAAHGNGSVAYVAGEKVAIKINLNNGGSATAIDATPQSVHALLWELTNVVGVAQTDLFIYDTMRRAGMARVQAACETDFPNVHYNDGSTVSGITFSGGAITTTNIGTEIANAKYLVNLAILKRHGKPDPNWIESYGNTGVTLTFKNHCGTVDACKTLHTELRDWNQSFGSYNPLVDLAASKNVGQKTVLFLLDGLYTGNLWNSTPQKWSLEPFSGDYPSSLFASQDPVAIDSVGLDFLRAEWELLANADNYLHEAALVGSPPSGTVYQPDGVAVTGSLGVHEHWNDSANKQYSRNLDPVNGQGIELVRAEDYVFGGGGTAGDTGSGGASTAGSSGGTSSAMGGTTSGASTGGTSALASSGGASSGTGGTTSDASSGGTTVVVSNGGMTGSGTGSQPATTYASGGVETALASASTTSEDADAIGESSGDDGGCGCRTGLGSRSNGFGPVVLLGIVAVGLRRRRFTSHA